MKAKRILPTPDVEPKHKSKRDTSKGQWWVDTHYKHTGSSPWTHHKTFIKQCDAEQFYRREARQTSNTYSVATNLLTGETP